MSELRWGGEGSRASGAEVTVEKRGGGGERELLSLRRSIGLDPLNHFRDCVVSCERERKRERELCVCVCVAVCARMFVGCVHQNRRWLRENSTRVYVLVHLCVFVLV